MAYQLKPKPEGMMRIFALIALLLLAGALAPGTADAAPCDLAAANAAGAGAGCATAWFDANLRINEIQTVGTQSSAKQLPDAGMLSLIRSADSSDDADALDFAEPPLAVQLDAGARSLGFDVAYDPKGGLFKSPAGASMGDELLADDYGAAMSAPGFKVIHVLDVDYHASCLTLTACLTEVAQWSRAHPKHVPIAIFLRANDTRTPMPGAAHPIPFDAAAFDALDAEIGSVFKPEELIIPDRVQGKYPSLKDAVAAHAWPKLGEARGKMLFVLDDDAKTTALYQGARRGLEGRAMFIATDEQSPVAAFVTIDDPARNGPRITQDVKAGLMVHTLADANTAEARKNDTNRRGWAFASGAQIISTDFLLADSRIGDYAVHLPKGQRADCDVQLAPERCAGLGVEYGNGADLAKSGN
jgi:Phosphoinositide phospholipase C, Ca2+-dependent